MADIRIDPHTLERAEERGASALEIEDVLQSGIPVLAKRGRLAEMKIFEFGAERGKTLPGKTRRSRLRAAGWHNGDGHSLRVLRSVERLSMEITYRTEDDLLYLRLDETAQQVVNQRVGDDIVLDIGDRDKIVGIEILNASDRVNLAGVLPLRFRVPVTQRTENP